ncbi:hypothetical protein AAEO57_10025 [Flavobacterium sp. DGU38]|uniref:Uncharacterized protein n=1 Tax=Flavobacterium calami TaxID=3139144 RepID=A0ABU9INU0_9FLAO
MKKNFFSSSILLSILPVLFFVLGCISLIKSSPALYEIDTDYLISLFLITALGSYLFLKNMVSVFISFLCTVNTLIAVLFFIDLFQLEYSVFTAAAILVSLFFSVFLNTMLLCGINRYKKPSEGALPAVEKTLTMHFYTIMLSLGGVSLLSLPAFYQNEHVFFPHFTTVLISGSASAVINAVMLLPLLANCWMGSVNEERMQDDLEHSFSEKAVLQLNRSIEKAVGLLAWVISPVVDYKPACWLITLFTALSIACMGAVKFENNLSLGNSQGNSLIILPIVYFLVVVLRYESYALAFAAVFSTLLNYFLLDALCQAFLSESEILKEICFYGSLIVSFIGTYLQTDMAFRCSKNNAVQPGTLLGSLSKTVYVVFVSMAAAVLFMVMSLYLSGTPDLKALLRAAVITSSSIILLLPVPAYLSVFLSLQELLLRKRKKKINSIYL